MLDKIKQTKNGMDSLIDRTRDAVVDATESAEHGVETAAKAAVKQAHVAGEHVRDSAKTARRDARRKVKHAAKAVDRGYTQARGNLSQSMSGITEYVTENPVKTVLLALSAGFLIAMLVRRT
jgi:ElaB/YqjD/DUF883 family membrane-anchored ribosome-binding protein